MDITDDCKDAMIERGVLMNGGVPAGHALLSQNVIRVALIDTDSNGEFPQEFLDRFRPLLEESEGLSQYTEMLDSPHRQPIGMRSIVKEAFGHWHKGEIVFVSPRDHADITIAPYSKDIEVSEDGVRSIHRGFATLPPNDVFHRAVLGGEDQMVHRNTGQLIGLNIDYSDGYNNTIARSVRAPTDEQRVVLVEDLKHELGHSFAIIHPHDAIDTVPNYTCSADEYEYLNDPQMPGIMSYGDPAGVHDHSRSFGQIPSHEHKHESWYDEHARESVQTGELSFPPRPPGG